MPMYPCIYCGSLVKRKPSQYKEKNGRVFCNRNCFSHYRKSLVEKVEVPCPQCGKLHFRSKADIRLGRKFCDNNCYQKYHAKTSKKCLNCGKEFLPNNRKQKFCSLSCSTTGENNPNYGKDSHNRFRHSEETKKALSDMRKGSKNPNWQGGKNAKLQYHDRELKKFAKAHIDQRCYICKSNTNLQLHHIIPRRHFSNPLHSHMKENLVYLCENHHKKTDAQVRKALKQKEYNLIPFAMPQLEPILSELKKDGLVCKKYDEFLYLEIEKNK